MRAAIAVQEQHPAFNANQLATTAKPQGDRYELNWPKTLVPLGGKAQLYLVAAEFHGKSKLFIVPADSAGVSFKAEPAMGLRAAQTGTLTLDKVQVSSDAHWVVKSSTSTSLSSSASCTGAHWPWALPSRLGLLHHLRQRACRLW